MPGMTLQDKKDQLVSRIADEVHDFHPLLQALLPKLVRVTRVDYTHGPNEKGADFVITRMDDTLESPEYVGVIAKIGKITQSLTTICDQIDDCAQKRYAFNGKQRIQLDEVWFVTNESISHNAQEKIHERFKTTKIKFLQHSDLIRLIDKHLAHFWTSIEVPIGEYLAQLKSRVEQEEMTRSLLPKHCKRFYVELRLSPIQLELKRDKRPARKSCTLSELIDSQTCTVVEGGPGSGKSHAIRTAILELATPENYVKNRVLPAFVSYSDLYRDHKLDVDSLLDSPPYEAVKKEVLAGATLVLFVDSFDELMLEGRDLAKELKSLTESVTRSPSRRLVLATRPVPVIDYEKILPHKAPAYEIEPLSLRQVLEFLKHICKDSTISARLFEDLKSSDLFKQLPHNPISAILLAQIVNDNSQDLPSNITDVYTRFSELMLGRWDADKGLQSHQFYEAATNVLMQIARYTVEHDLTEIGEAEARGFFEDYLRRRNIDIDPAQLYERTVTRSGIIQENDLRRTVCFKHRTFAEYFYALHKYRHLDKRFIDDRIYSIAWRTVYFFFVGLNKDCEDVLQEMMAIKPRNPDEQFWRYVNMPEYLLAGYATPYEVVEHALPVLINEARDLYFKIANHEIESPLDELPEVFVLNFFEAVTRSCYGYRFFLRAMDATVLALLADPSETRERKAYAMFFLSTLYRALEKDNPYDGLLTEFDRDIPFPIQLGVFYDSKHVKHHSAILNRNGKRVRHEMKKNPALRSYAKRLHELPVGKKSRTIASSSTPAPARTASEAHVVVRPNGHGPT